MLAQRLVLWKRQDALQAIRLSMEPQDDFVRLEYRGRTPMVILNALKKGMVSGNSRRWEMLGRMYWFSRRRDGETNIPRHACGEPFADRSNMLVPDMPTLQTRSNFPELVLIAGGSGCVDCVP